MFCTIIIIPYIERLLIVACVGFPDFFSNGNIFVIIAIVHVFEHVEKQLKILGLVWFYPNVQQYLW